jgi:hypothetical protein
MLGKTFSRFKKQKNKVDFQTASQASQTASALGELAKMLSASGRVGLANLRKICQEKDKDSFVRFLRQPVLAGDFCDNLF